MFDEGHFGDVFGQMRIFDEGHFWPDEDFLRGPQLLAHVLRVPNNQTQTSPCPVLRPPELTTHSQDTRRRCRRRCG